MDLKDTPKQMSWVMSSKQLEVRILAVFDYCDAYVGEEKNKPNGLKRHTRTDVITQ